MNREIANLLCGNVTIKHNFSNFVLENGKLNFEIKCILVKYPFRFLSKIMRKLWGPWPDWPSISLPVVSVFAVDASFRDPLTPNPGDAADII